VVGATWIDEEVGRRSTSSSDGEQLDGSSFWLTTPAIRKGRKRKRFGESARAGEGRRASARVGESGNEEAALAPVPG